MHKERCRKEYRLSTVISVYVIFPHFLDDFLYYFSLDQRCMTRSIIFEIKCKKNLFNAFRGKLREVA